MSPGPTPLDVLFTDTLPALFGRAPRAAGTRAGLVGVVATGAPEHGYWVVSIADGVGRRGAASDRPDVVVEASAAVLALLFSGTLDVEAAIAGGALVVRGDRGTLEELSDRAQAVRRTAAQTADARTPEE